jgi:iron-sulfur cluster protein
MAGQYTNQKEIKMDKHFKEKILAAIKNPDLQKGLKKAIDNFKIHRTEALSELNINEIQSEIGAIRNRSINNIENNIEMLKIACKNNGTILYEVSDAVAACEKILEIINKHKGKKVVKAKSMVSEEIELNNYLINKDIEVIETDLGEWLIQLAGEKPSHITAPALHMTKKRIVEIIDEKLGKKLNEDSLEITRYAREKLRKEFIEADIGLTGANLIVTETGSVVIVSNEGNARLVSTLPSVHIVLATPEKLVETMTEAHKILHILPKCSTGQSITSYVSIISGPSRTADIQKELVIGVHGPEHVYIVLLDNGRKAMLDDPDFREALKCIKCGSCLGLCPVYQAVGGHVYGDRYLGGIGTLLAAFLQSQEDANNLAQLCAGCGICSKNCPAAIDISGLNLKLKEILARKKLLPVQKAFMLKFLFSNKMIFNSSLYISGIVQKCLFRNQEDIDNLPVVFSELTRFRILPRFADQTLSKKIRDGQVLSGENKNTNTYVFFSGCLAQYIYIEEAINAIKLLQKIGYNVLVPEKQVCCGVPALYSGQKDAYERFIEENRKQFQTLQSKDIKGIFTICPSCTSGIKDAGLINGAEVYDMASLLYQVKDELQLKVIGERITCHPSCHSETDSEGISYLHLLLKDLYKEKFIEYFDMYNCCGAAGSYAIEQPYISENIIKRKLNHILESGAETIVVDCPACLMQIKGYVKKHHLSLRVVFLTDLFTIE